LAAALKRVAIGRELPETTLAHSIVEGAPLKDLKDQNLPLQGSHNSVRSSKLMVVRPEVETIEGNQPLPTNSDAAVTSGVQELALKESPTLRIRPISAPTYQFQLLQQWEGRVQDISGDEFSAALVDLTNKSRPEEEVVIPTEEISPEDMKLLAPGAVFYWMIGYSMSNTGQKTRASNIRFRRLPVWSRSDLKKAAAAADEMMEVLGIGVARSSQEG